jgi:hypothetical protein
MKIAMQLLLALNLASGVALADNPTDAPLESDATTIAQAQPQVNCAPKHAKKAKATPAAVQSHGEDSKNAKVRQNSGSQTQTDRTPITGPMFGDVGQL